jgi:hypothetical protein
VRILSSYSVLKALPGFIMAIFLSWCLESLGGILIQERGVRALNMCLFFWRSKAVVCTGCFPFNCLRMPARKSQSRGS